MHTHPYVMVISFRVNFEEFSKKFRAQATPEEDTELQEPRTYNVTEVGIDTSDGEIIINSSVALQ